MDEFTKAMRRSEPAEMTSYERKRLDQQAGNLRGLRSEPP
jgi:hypothetical protein